MIQNLKIRTTRRLVPPGTHVEENTTKDETTAPSGGSNLGAYVSETNQATSHTPHTIEEILGAHDINDTSWEDTNPTDVSIDTVNSKEQMPRSHITKFHIHEDNEIAPEDSLSQVNQQFDS